MQRQSLTLERVALVRQTAVELLGMRSGYNTSSNDMGRKVAIDIAVTDAVALVGLTELLLEEKERCK